MLLHPADHTNNRFRSGEVCVWCVCVCVLGGGGEGASGGDTMSDRTAAPLGLLLDKHDEDLTLLRTESSPRTS